MTAALHLQLAYDLDMAIREIKSRGLWPHIMNAAQRHGLEFRAVFNIVERTRLARGDAWEGMINDGATTAEIAGWWDTLNSRVDVVLTNRMKDRGGRAQTADEETPRLIRGEGDRRDDCALYMGCLKTAGKAFFGQARCPLRCTGYRATQLHATDFMKQKECGEKNAAPTGAMRG